MIAVAVGMPGVEFFRALAEEGHKISYQLYQT
jgi:hypothetical protein